MLARDATYALGSATDFTRTAREIGPVAYLYGGRSYATLPVLRMRIDRLRREASRLIGMSVPAGVPIALAASPPCGAGLFGLADISWPT